MVNQSSPFKLKKGLAHPPTHTFFTEMGSAERRAKAAKSDTQVGRDMCFSLVSGVWLAARLASIGAFSGLGAVFC